VLVCQCVSVLVCQCVSVVVYSVQCALLPAPLGVCGAAGCGTALPRPKPYVIVIKVVIRSEYSEYEEI
jgi:hypothetical protein